MLMKTARQLERRAHLWMCVPPSLQPLLSSAVLHWVETQFFNSQKTIFNSKVTPSSRSAAGFFNRFSGPGWLVGGRVGLRFPAWTPFRTQEGVNTTTSVTQY